VNIYAPSNALEDPAVTTDVCSTVHSINILQNIYSYPFSAVCIIND